MNHFERNVYGSPSVHEIGEFLNRIETNCFDCSVVIKSACRQGCLRPQWRTHAYTVKSLSTEEVTRTQDLQGDVEVSCTDKTKTPCITHDP